jgi:hypothetical protein
LQDIIGDHVDLFFATPQSVVEQVPAAMVKSCAASGVAPYPRISAPLPPPVHFSKSEIERWGRVVRDNHIEGQV